MGQPNSARVPHKHAALIKAWADGAEIQRYSPVKGWESCICSPLWDNVFEKFRIKPKTIKCRHYLVRYNGGKYGVNSVMDWEVYEPQMHYRFVKWLGDWQEVEV